MINAALIAGRLRDARNRRNLSQEEAAEIIKCNIKTVSRSELYGINSLKTLDKMCNAYDIHIIDVLYGDSDLSYLATVIRKLGPKACIVISELCKSMNSQ